MINCLTAMVRRLFAIVLLPFSVAFADVELEIEAQVVEPCVEYIVEEKINVMMEGRPDFRRLVHDRPDFLDYLSSRLREDVLVEEVVLIRRLRRLALSSVDGMKMEDLRTIEYSSIRKMCSEAAIASSLKSESAP